MKLELLSPAKNLEFGREAINHGADAVYVGAPAFGARQAATNSIEDIGQLVEYAHLYGAKVFATVNTVLTDDELEPATRMVHQLYNAGVDALIVQDMGLLRCDLPPIELHASTQCHNADPEQVAFMQRVGFRRVILARELSIDQMRAIREATSVELEAFVHGALCVSYSGRCYMSQYVAGRSGNRGCCSQPCRSTYDLMTADGRMVMRERHLLSLRDLNASQHLGSMIDAGITSFKIEGRLKDLGYVKNVTAHYRRMLDGLMEGHERASSGTCSFGFEPDVERTFNRGYTTYFLNGRQPMASLETQKSRGKAVGKVTSVGKYTIGVESTMQFAPGDGLCFIGTDGRMQGFLVNEVRGLTLTPNEMPQIRVGTPLWRNNDIQFERILKGNTAERKIGVRLLFCATRRGFSVDITDEDGLTATQHVKAEHTPAESTIKSTNLIIKQLSKLGNTPFEPLKVADATEGQYFVPALMLNQLRRGAVELLRAKRIAHFRPADRKRVENRDAYPVQQLDYRFNVVNSKAEEFYNQHGASVVEHGLEQTADYDGKALMTTKYCLRYELGCCLQGKNTEGAKADIRPDEQLLMRNNERSYHLEFDCKNCQMIVRKG